MKAYIGNINWADEGDILFFSIITERELKLIKLLLLKLIEFDLIGDGEYYWRTNEYFEYSPEDLLNFIEKTVDISEEEQAVFTKFNISGFDIYEQIKDTICRIIWSNRPDPRLTLIKQPIIELFGERLLGKR